MPALRSLIDSPRHEVIAVLTRPDAASGRHGRLQPSPVARLALEQGIPLLRPERPNSAEFVAELSELRPDCCPVVAFGALLRDELLAVPTHGWVNLHFSILPAWRGAAPVQHAVLAGDDVTGATTFRLEEGLDTGPVYGVVTDTIAATDTSGAVLDRLARSGAQLLVTTLDGIEAGRLVPVPQPSDGISHAPKLSTADARVDWTAPALRVDRLVRAMTPDPGAWTVLRGERLGLGPVQVAPVAQAAPPSGLAPGELLATKSEVLVGTGGAAVRLGDVRPRGRRTMAAADWARGVRLQPGERFET